MKLEIRNLCVKHKDKVLLENINLCIPKGRTLVLLGISGSGKTLCASFLQGLMPNNLTFSGDIMLDNAPIAKAPLSSIVQNPKTCFNDMHSIKSHIRESCTASMDKIIETLKIVGLDKEVLDMYPFMLSGGMLQRVMIAISLLSNKDFLIADEPTSDLDYDIAYKILSLIKDIQKSHSKGILFITHDLDMALYMADCVAFLHEGSIVQVIEVNKILESSMATRLGEILQERLRCS